MTIFPLLLPVIGPLAGVIVGALLHKTITLSVAREIAGIEKQRDIETRVWESRRVGYSVVLDRLGDVSTYEKWIDNGYNGHGGRHAAAFHGSHSHETYRAGSQDSWIECKKEFSQRQLIFSEPFVNAFRQLNDKIYSIDREDFEGDIAAQRSEYYQKAYTDLLHIAQGDLALTQESWDRQG